MWRRMIALVYVVSVLGMASSASAGLIAHWPLDGNAKDAADGHHGTLVGGATFVKDASRGTVLKVDGVTGHVVVPDTQDLRFVRSSTFTLAAWVYLDALPGKWQGIMSKSRDQGDHYGIWITDAGEWMGGGWENRGSKAPTKVWVHVAHVHDGPAGTSVTYVNGAVDWSGGLRSSFTTAGAGEFWIGGAQLPPGNANEMLGGMISDVQVYNRALTASQITEVMNGKPILFTKAEKPAPGDGAVGVNMPLLQWTPGDTALLHDVYVGTTPDLTAAERVATHQPMTMVYLIQGLKPGVTYYWRVDEINGAGAVQTGDVWSFIAQALTAYHPSPADGAVDAAPAPVLTWSPGQAAFKHHLYFGNSSEAVAQGAPGTDKGELTDATFAPGTLDSLTAYYWRVDESVAGGTVRTGPVWTFITCLSVDDFESYTDTVGSAVFDTWIDGLTNGLSGSVVGNATAPFSEQKIVHGGKQSMPLDFNNVKSPFYSETVREFSPAQDWTANGIGTLIVYVQGRVGNASAPLYVALEDTAKQAAGVPYTDTAVTRATQWTQWKIPLTNFAGVNLAKVKKLYLGVGDKKNPAAGGTGRIYIDDIRVTKP